jgi:hypothetical protein
MTAHIVHVLTAPLLSRILCATATAGDGDPAPTGLQSSEEASKSSPALIQFQFQLLADLFVLGSAAEEIPAAPAELFVLGLLAELEDAQVSSPLRPGRACPTLTEELPRNPSIALPLGSRGWSSRTTVGSKG